MRARCVIEYDLCWLLPMKWDIKKTTKRKMYLHKQTPHLAREIITLTTVIVFRHTIPQHLFRDDLVSGAMEGDIWAADIHRTWNHGSQCGELSGPLLWESCQDYKMASVSLPCHNAANHFYLPSLPLFSTPVLKLIPLVPHISSHPAVDLPSSFLCHLSFCFILSFCLSV